VIPKRAPNPGKFLFAAVQASFILVFAASPARSAGSLYPVEYPTGTIGNPRPQFIWQDLYSERDRGVNVKYRLTVQKKGGADIPSRSWFLVPALYQASFYHVTAPEPFDPGAYDYSIDRILDGRPDTSRFYHYRRYPLRGAFILDLAERRDFESLETAHLIRYLTLERDNRFRNGYNALFFTGSASITLGVGILFYSVIDLGWVSTVVSAICFVSSGIGYGAAGYYGWQYYDGRRDLAKIVDAERRASLNDGAGDGRFTAAAELKF